MSSSVRAGGELPSMSRTPNSFASAAATIPMIGRSGHLSVSRTLPLSWALYLVLLTSAAALSFGVLRFRVKREPKPRWITPLASAALIVAIIFGSAHTALIH